jgi:quinoprotein glucose dehydrogenase
MSIGAHQGSRIARLAGLVLAVVAGGAWAQRAAAQSVTAPLGEWRFYGSDAGSTKYSPLDQINKDNVKNLRIAWRWKTDNFGAVPQYNMEATPLMVKGVLYSTVGARRDVVAIDGATGETLWVYRYDEGQRGAAGPRQNHRGVAYWPNGGGDGRILYITAGYHLIELDAKTGRPVQSFGTDGIVDLYEGLDRPAPKDGLIGSSSPPLVVGDIVIVGAALQPSSPTKENIAGFVRGFDVRTGKRVWIFHTIPVLGEFGNETWEKDSWSFTGNTAVWAPMSADETLGYVYLPVETPTNDFFGGDRPGNNLFADSLVCLDAKTGKRIWHYQLVHHGIWDYDTVAPPILLDITVNGRKIQAVAQITKQAFTYVFNRVTGEPVWPIEERAVPQSDVPREQTSPTQPFPTKPPAFDRQNIAIDDLIDFTPELRAEAIKMVEDYKLGGVFSPPVVPGANGIKNLLKVPSATGGANWQGGAADPETGVIYVASGTQVTGGQMPRLPNGAAAGPRMFGPQGLPIIKPPYGRITAIDLNTGEHLWMMPNSDTPQWIKDHPALKGVNVPRTGNYEHSGIMVTKTLVFAGEGAGLFAVTPGSGGPIFRSYDKKTGQIISEFTLPANQSGIPMTYMVNGKQYIVVAVGAVGHPAEFVALTVD